jgi:RNA polymerase sigma-70 factor (ECF subfamily)
MDVSAEHHSALQQLLQEQSPFFLGVISSYVVRMDLARGDAVGGLALMVWQETAIEALAHVERFARASQPRAWILAVAANVLKRKRYEMARQVRYELSVSGLMNNAEDIQESAFFDQIANLAVPGPEQEIEAQEQVREMLSLVSDEDQYVLRLALLHDLDGQMLAQALGVLPSTARSRLHRALARLRAAWTQHEQQMKEA